MKSFKDVSRVFISLSPVFYNVFPGFLKVLSRPSPPFPAVYDAAIIAQQFSFCNI
jgi:hypothetical protein